MIPTCNVNPTYFGRKASCQNGNTQPQLASASLLLCWLSCIWREALLCTVSFPRALEPAVYSVFPDCGSVLSAASPLSCSRPSPSHDEMLPDGIARLGKWGMIVPAVTTNPSSNFARAKSLASVSVSNVCVDRERRLRTAVPRQGTSKVTYQVCLFIR